MKMDRIKIVMGCFIVSDRGNLGIHGVIPKNMLKKLKL
jgi:hypothetical protein